ncbi:HlyD family secretion protein [Sandaracinobacteroides saxicola]|uniref:HlyD family secretion protein n=1 Tax=Sandaracinobacteroides saxicola TaxID=2759707 RepID=A0A7G5IDZ9_9SPHN|nr:HlyD family secretion protein [Sandaracinobacteroides saxicola]QMW21591.1 HlyD family secretion protein [Sandaracinobacteroides saxicola]
MKRHVASLAFAGLGLVAVAIVASAWGFAPMAGEALSTDDAYVRGDVTVIAPRVAGYVDRVLVSDFAHVREGEPLVRLRTEDYVAQVARAEAVLRSREAALAANVEAQQEALAAIEQARASRVAGQAERQRSATSFARGETLWKQGVYTTESLDQARAARDSSAANVIRAAAAVDAAKAHAATLVAQAAGLQADVATAKADLDLARIQAGYTVLAAPADGVVGERMARVGQYVQPGVQVFALVPSRGRWIIANFRETQLARIAIGDRVKVSVDALGDARIDGRVTAFAPASGSDFALLPPDNATGNFTKIVRRFGVRIDLDGPASTVARLRPGMSVVVSVQPNRVPTTRRQVTAR